jgi:hypothetical protein
MDVLVKKKLAFGAVLLTAAALISAGVAPAQAAPVADDSQTGLTGNDYTSIANTGFSTNWVVGSPFRAGISGSLTSINLPIYYYDHYSGASFDAQMQVWNVDGGGLPTGSALATQTIPVASLTPFAATPGTLSVAFSAPATITAGTNYAFTIGFIIVGAGWNELGYEAGLAPAGKRLIENSMGSLVVDGTYGINFTTYVDAGSSSQPLANTGRSESVTTISLGVSAGLIAAGALALVVVRRRLARE